MKDRFRVCQAGEISVVYVVVSFSQADIDTPVPHNLGQVPSGWSVAKIDQYATIKDGAMPWTDKVIYLQTAFPAAGDTVTATIRVEAINTADR